MIYIYIIIGFWTLLALCWSVAFLVADGEAGNPSKLERLVIAAEAVGEAYRRSQL
jgi:hypothetical protein